MADRTIKLALVGAGMFGGDVHLRAFADLQRSGLAPYLGRLGLDEFSRPLADVKFELVAVATRSEASAKRAAAEYRQRIGADVRQYHGEKPWDELLRDHRDLDALAVATPDNLQTEPGLAGLNRDF